MRESKTPGTTPKRTPKGFRALFSLWEGGRKDSPQKGGNDASLANETQQLPDPSPLKTSTTSSILPADAATPVLPGPGADAAASPAVIHSGHRGEAAEDSTWGSNWESSGPEATAGMGSMDVDLHDQVTEKAEDHTLKSMAEQEVNLRASFPPDTNPASAGKYPDLMPDSEPNASTPTLFKENSKTPSSFGVTPPILRPSTAQPSAAVTAQPLPANSPVKSPMRGPTSKGATPSPTIAPPTAEGIAAASAGADDTRTSGGSFGTCRSLSPELADEGTTCSIHAGCTPALPLRNQKLSPAPTSQPSDSQLPSDPRLPMHDASVATASPAPSPAPPPETSNNMNTGNANTLDAPLSEAPVSFPPPADTDSLALTTSKKEEYGSMHVPLSTRPEVSSPILDELERSGGSNALARAGSSLSNTLSRISSGAATVVAAAAGTGDAPVATDGKPVSRHRHQRSGALDFDAFLLSAEEEDQRAHSDEENKSATLQDVPDAMFVTATEEDVRGSGDTVDTIVVHSPSMRDVPDDGPEHSLSLSKLATFDTSAAECHQYDQQPPSGGFNGVDNGPDDVNVSCASHPLNVSNSSFTMDQPADAVTDANASVAAEENPVAAGSADAVSPVAEPSAEDGAGSSVVFAPAVDDTMMQSPIAAVVSDRERGTQSDVASAAAGFQFDTAMEGTTPIAFGSASIADANANSNANDVDMAGSSPAVHAPASAEVGAACTSDMEHDNSSVPEQPAPGNTPGCDVVLGPVDTSQPSSARSAGVSPRVQNSPAAQASPVAASSIPKQPSSAQSRETTPPVQDALAAADCETTPKQTASAAGDIETPDSTPVAVALARCRAELNSGQAALGSISTDADDCVDDAALQGTANSMGRSPQPHTSSPLSHGGLRREQPAEQSPTASVSASVPAAAGAIASSPLKSYLGGFREQPGGGRTEHTASVIPAGVSEAEVKSVPAAVEPSEEDNLEQQQQQEAAATGADEEMVDDECPDDDHTAKVERHNLPSDESTKVTPPNLGSQGSQSLSDDKDHTCMHSPTGPSGPPNPPGSKNVLHGPVPSFSPAQRETAPAAATGGAPYSDTMHEKRALIIETHEDITAQLCQGSLACSYDGPDDVTESGSVLNASSAWRSVVGVNDSMDSVVARSATDSIFGIASDICCAAVGGALTSSYGGLGSAGPRSPLPSGMHTRTGSAFTQRTQVTPYSSVDTENLLASTEFSAPPTLPRSASAATAAADVDVDTAAPTAVAAAAPRQVLLDARASQDEAVEPSGPAAVIAYEEEAALPGENTEVASLLGRLGAAQEMADTATAAVQNRNSPSPSAAPKSAKVPTPHSHSTLPPAPQYDTTPEGLAKPAFAQQPSRCSSGGGGSGAFRVTDSCADRVWRMLRGSLEDGQGADSMKLDAIASTDAAEADGSEDHNRRDSLALPDMPTMDLSEFEALETEVFTCAGKSKRSLSLTPTQQAATSAADQPIKSAWRSPAVPPALPAVNVPDASMEASGTPTGELPKLQMCMSPSFDAPIVCASPRVPGGATGGAKKVAQQGNQISPTVAAAPSREGDKRAADVRARSIKNALVNQSLTGTALTPATDCEQLLTDSVDFGEAGSPTGQHQRTVAMPSGSLACLPEASDIPSPDQVPVRKSDWNVLESREWRCVEEERPATAPQFNAGARQGQLASLAVVADDSAADMQPFTSTFDVHAAIASGEQQRPTTPSRRRKSNSSAAQVSPSSQPLRAVTAGPKSSTKLASPRSPTTCKRSLSRRTIANITPNHNPNFMPHSPGRTPEAIPVNSSPSAKRSRRSHKAMPSPVSTGALLRASSETDRLDVPPRMHEGCGKALEYGDSPADIDMHASSPSLTACNQNPNRHADHLDVPEHSPLTGSHGQGGSALQRSTPGAARSSRMTPPPSVRGSASLMRVPECSEMEAEQEGAANNAERGHADADRSSLRKSLLSIDPMRVSYGTDGLVNLAGEDDCVLFQTDIQAITAALDEYPNRPSTAPAPSRTRPGSLGALADPPLSNSPNTNTTKCHSSQQWRSNGSSAITAAERLGKSPAAFGVSPLRASRVAAAKAAAAANGDGVDSGGSMVPGEGGTEECADMGELQLRLAVALRQAEHWRREMDTHAEAKQQNTQELEAEREENRILRNKAQKLQDKVERQQNVIEAEAFLDAGDRDHTASLLGDDFATNMRAQETFEAEKRLLQADIAHWQDKYTHVANNLLPHAESATSFAKEDAENAGNEAKAARQAAAAALVQVQEIRAQFEQKERQLQRQLQTLRTDLDKQSLRASEAEAAQQCLQERVQGLQKEANEKDGLYHAKCKELSVAKIRGGPSGIGGGIGAGKLKQQLESVSEERNSLLERLRTLERRTGR